MAREQIYVPLCGGPGDHRALAAAEAVAGAYDAEVRAVFIGVDDTSFLMVAGDGATGIGVAAVEALRAERARAQVAAIEAAGAFGLTAEVYDGLRSAATASARLAALAVVEPDAARGRGALGDIFEALLLEDGVPVYVARESGPVRAMAVAWDGSREAAHALKAAGPLITAVQEVRVIQAPAAVDVKNAPAADPERVRAWIASRNPRALVEVATIEEAPSDGLLQAAAQGGGVDLLVAGAYGHTRLREAVFGGVTRSMLLAEGPSLLLAH